MSVETLPFLYSWWICLFMGWRVLFLHTVMKIYRTWNMQSLTRLCSAAVHKRKIKNWFFKQNLGDRLIKEIREEKKNPWSKEMQEKCHAALSLFLYIARFQPSLVTEMSKLLSKIISHVFPLMGVIPVLLCYILFVMTFAYSKKSLPKTGNLAAKTDPSKYRSHRNQIWKFMGTLRSRNVKRGQISWLLNICFFVRKLNIADQMH